MRFVIATVLWSHSYKSCRDFRKFSDVSKSLLEGASKFDWKGREFLKNTSKNKNFKFLISVKFFKIYWNAGNLLEV